MPGFFVCLLISLKVQSKNSDFFFFFFSFTSMSWGCLRQQQQVRSFDDRYKIFCQGSLCVRLYKAELRDRKAYSTILIHCVLPVI